MKVQDYQALSKAKRLDWACGEILIGIGAGEFRAAVERVLTLAAEAEKARQVPSKRAARPRAKKGKAQRDTLTGLTPVQLKVLRRLASEDPRPLQLGRGEGPAARFLIRDGLVAKDESGYRLTDAGRARLAQA